MRSHLLSLVTLAALTCNCSSTTAPGLGNGAAGSTTGGASSTTTGGTTSGSTGGTTNGSSSGVVTGPISFPVTNADPNGIWWEPSNSTLYLADNQNLQVLTWTDDAGFATLATLPGPAGNEVGGIVRLPDGTLVVVEFGFGTAGSVVYVTPDGGTGTVANLDMTKRRLGLTLASDGTLYDSYFYKVSSATTGYVAQLDIVAGTETDLVTTSLEKPVGVVAVDGTLYISDQSEGEVFSAPIASPSSIQALSTNLTPDLLSAGPSGTIFSGSPSGVVYQINTSTGQFSTLVTAGGTLEPRGTAYDAVNQRLFIAEHDSADVANYLEIVPVSP